MNETQPKRRPPGPSKLKMVAYKFPLALIDLIDEMAAEQRMSKTMLVEVAIEAYARQLGGKQESCT